MAATQEMKPNGEPAWTLQTPPPLPAGYDKHHIVFLEAVHLPLAPLPFEYTIDIHQRTQGHEIAERIKPATIVISNVLDVKPSDMDHAPNLQLLAVLATGMGWVDKEYCAKRGISVVNSPGANIDAVSEHFMALYFASRKRLGVIDQNVKTSDEWLKTYSLTKKVWPEGPPLGVKQETLGIVGYGALGQNIAALAKAIGFREVLVAERKGAVKIRMGRVTFEDLLTRSTTIVLVCPREPDTINLIDEHEFGMMKKEVLLINIARGGIVNEAELAKALKEHRIFGAATDVLDSEPGGPGTTPLLPDLSKGEDPVPNLIVTSHVAWFSGSTIANLQKVNCDAMTAFVEGRMYDPKARACVAVHDGKTWK
ncbi:Glycerate dehydrogenase [Fulvia fulva]|uniref:Glycerate dehydrogenase n=1 Tax=Passalora fulva TaxID=5499 RepID=A0A9Q8USF3_PASFU|nr:Glycerate dehydrogenase [Fulvia fulva]KAK4617849.1 Glycerate dehydrogenase [Fulvia fulva]KAK4618911.1 Glycerate dehydrogenase [Fulvia fulva]UJO20712.1 Glycerate dehydrogenase [Fulvia fulva]WPV18021.1 Glycerate dehydrogenase [Fulvia fulva]WPV32771.1 Glycerate dehydrogenase [Fulvia fulva]